MIRIVTLRNILNQKYKAAHPSKKYPPALYEPKASSKPLLLFLSCETNGDLLSASGDLVKILVIGIED